MTAVICYIGLGSNLDGPHQQIQSAVKALELQAFLELLDVSPLYRSVAVGPGMQPDYCNAAAKLQTELTATDLLAVLQSIEKSQGRDRSNSQRWGARTLDLDILLYGAEVANDARLTLPHPEIQSRNFVMQPLLDIAPGLVIPGVGAVDDLLALVGEGGLSLWDEGCE